MVHGLETLKALNSKASAHKEVAKVPVPDAIALHPAAARRFVNSPWPKESRAKNQPDVFATYAESSAEPFKGKALHEDRQP